MAVFNFLNLSPTYRATVGQEIQIRRDVLTSEAGLTDDYRWPVRKTDMPRIKEILEEKGIIVSGSVFKYDQGTLRTTYLFLTGDETARAAMLGRAKRKDPYCLAIPYFLKDGITSWEAVQQLAMEPVDVTEEEEIQATVQDDFISELLGTRMIAELPAIEALSEEKKEEGPTAAPKETAPAAPAASETATFSIEPDKEEMADVSSEILLRMACEEFEHLKRAASAAAQLLERFVRREKDLEERLESAEERIEILEETIAGAPTLKDVPELQQLLGITDKLAQEEKELEKIYGELPCTSPHHGSKKVVYQDRFLDEFHGMDKADAKRVVKQLKTLFNKGGEYPSLQSKRLWHHDLPGTPKGSWSSKAGGGGPHASRFTWADTDTCVTVFGLYPRNDLF